MTVFDESGKSTITAFREIAEQIYDDIVSKSCKNFLFKLKLNKRNPNMSVSEDTNLNFNLVILSYEIDSKLNPSKDLEQNAEQNEDIIENKEQSVTVYIFIYTTSEVHLLKF